MTMNGSSQQPIDPELKRRLQQMRDVPPRNPEAAARGKAQFIAEVDEIVKEQGFSNNSQSIIGTTFFQRWKEKWNMATPRTRMVFTFVTAFVLVAVFLFGGAGMTAYASQSALPGDALYSVKTGVEQTQVNLARDAAEKARLNLAFAERRLDEIARLIDNGRFADIAQAVQEYEKYVQSAIAELETVAAGDPTSAQELASQVALLLNRYAQTLSGMVGALPDTARTEVERAIQVSNTAGNMRGEFEFVGTVEAINAASWVVGGRTLALIAASEIKGGISVGSVVKVHAWEDANGGLVLREVELATQDDLDDDLNGNFNGNANDDDGNMNGNTNGNQNGDDQEEFTAVVEQIGAGFWVIGGRTLAITAGSEIKGGIDVGDLVKVEFIRDASGNLILREVEIAGDDDANTNDNNDDDRNSNDDDDDNANSNSNFNGDDDDDDHNANMNSNDNNDGDDNRNGNVNQNSNDDGGDDNRNSNQNSNDNDDDDDNQNSNDNDDDDDNRNDNDDDNRNDNDDDKGNDNDNGDD